MDALAGRTVAVTAGRRAEEQAGMFRKRGAAVLLTPAVATERMEGEEAVRRATAEVIAARPDVVVAATGVGVRSWLAGAGTHGLADDLARALRGATVVARGSKAKGALAAAGVEVAWRAPGETMAEVLEHLLGQGVAGSRIAVQHHGGPSDWFSDALRAQGAFVVDVAPYRWADAEPDGLRRLAALLEHGDVDAVTFTSSPAVAAVAAALPPGSIARRRWAERRVLTACVGHHTGGHARDLGFTDLVIADPPRLGAMVQALTRALVDRPPDGP